MPRPRVSQVMPRMAAPRSSRLQPSTSRSHSDPLPHRCSVHERTAKPGGHSRSSSSASVRSADSANQRKLGTRITDLESRLGQAQKELRDLKGQLSVSAVPTHTGARNKRTTSRPISTSRRSLVEEKRVETERQRESADVFEVPNSSYEPDDITTEPEQMLSGGGSVLKEDDEVTSLRSKLEERAEELQVAFTARESLKSQLTEASENGFSARNKEEATGSRLTQVAEELESSRENILQLKKNLDQAEAAKRALEEEMEELSLQTEKWKAAADAAAQVLSEGAEKEAMRASGIRGSIDKNFLSILFETPSLDSYGEVAGDFGRDYPRSSGSRTFADLWKWKGLK